MDDRDLALAAVLRGYLVDKPGSAQLDARLAELIEQGQGGADVSGALKEIFELPDLAEWVSAVRGDPFLRPPEVVALLEKDRGVLPDQGLPGEPQAVAATKFMCPNRDFTWFLQQLGDEIPPCPTHQVNLVAERVELP